MSSQNASAAIAEALAPKRQRGRDRVAAILSTATELFAEKGYDAVTMTEIAARSSTAIGSLYRFFPTKDVLVTALVERYGAMFGDLLGEVIERAPEVSGSELADALVSIGDSLRSQRAVVLKLIDVPDDGHIRRQQMRTTFKDGLARVLSGFGKAHYAADDAPVVLLLGLLKSIWSFEPDTIPARADYGLEARRMITLYLAGLADRGEARGTGEKI
ncbi:MAG TPA: TetR/AcrR family transcriptional regulator [Acidisoma sp.]|jgi:AcrR family transcriptional regulator|nr:TetR/AcrR family transcriptional regulator [Acidisoma sp.]